MNEPYPWSQKYTQALNTGVRIDKLILRAAATARAMLRRVHDVAARRSQRWQRMRQHQRRGEFDESMLKDTNIGRSLISETALDRYRASLAWWEGYSETHFELTETLDPPPRSTTGTWGFVIVTCKVTGVERRYRAGPLLSWTDAFDADIKRGVYLAASPDVPPKVVVLHPRRASE
jgi:hypothetical protein